MSDFLSRLSNRALGGAPEIRPRVPSPFEGPAAASMRPPLDLGLETDALAPAWPFMRSADASARSVPVTAAAVPQPATPPMPRQPMHEPRQRERRDALNDLPRAPVQAHARVEQTIEPSPRGRSKHERPSEPALDVDTLGPVEQTSRSRNATPPAARIAQAETDAPHGYGERRTPSRAVAAQRGQMEEGSIGPAAPLRRADVSRAEQTPARQAAEPKPVRVEASPVAVRIAPPPSREAEQVSAPPQVHVTIGRIEIRATVPRVSTPDAPTSQGSQRMSLDDYLKRATRGRR